MGQWTSCINHRIGNELVCTTQNQQYRGTGGNNNKINSEPLTSYRIELKIYSLKGNTTDCQVTEIDIRLQINYLSIPGPKYIAFVRIQASMSFSGNRFYKEHNKMLVLSYFYIIQQSQIRKNKTKGPCIFKKCKRTCPSKEID